MLQNKLFCGLRLLDSQLFTGNTANLLGWQAGFAAGIVYNILLNNITRSQLHGADDEMFNKLVADAFDFAACCAQNLDNCITDEFAANKRAALEQAQKLREQA